MDRVKHPQFEYEIEPWTATATTLGPFSNETPFDVSAIARLLPEFEVKYFDAEGGELDRPSIRARRGDASNWCLHFAGDPSGEQVVTIRVFEPGRIANAFMIGSKFSNTLLKYDRCFRNQGPMSAYVNCDVASEPWLIYWLSSKQLAFDKSFDLPPRAAMDETEIVYISWVPFAPPSAK
jgi:hypothetical protein